MKKLFNHREGRQLGQALVSQGLGDERRRSVDSAGFTEAKAG
jgi:hypothetical protein